jgi:hypothetical protein
LWLSPDGPPDGDRAEAAQYLHGYAGRDKIVVDIHIQDGEPFFIELERYLKEDQPYRRLAELKAVCESYRRALEANFSLGDVLGT